MYDWNTGLCRKKSGAFFHWWFASNLPIGTVATKRIIVRLHFVASIYCQSQRRPRPRRRQRKRGTERARVSRETSVNANFDSSQVIAQHIFCHSTHIHIHDLSVRERLRLFFTEKKFSTIPSKLHTVVQPENCIIIN